MNGALAVSRYTLLELSRRRLLLVFLIIGVLGIALLGVGLKLLANAVGPTAIIGSSGGQPISGSQAQQVLELGFVSDLIGAVQLFGVLIAFAIGMTAIYHDLESGAAVSIFSKPVTRLAFSTGKVAAAAVAMIVIVGVLSLEARFVMFLFGGGLEGALWVETLAAVANGVLLMLLVLALSTWMNNIVAAVIAFVYHNVVASIVVALHQALDSGNLGNNSIVSALVNVFYWFVPHPLRSDAQREIARRSFEIISPQNANGQGPTPDQIVAGIPGASSAGDVVWWLFLVAVFAALVYVAVRRRQV